MLSFRVSSSLKIQVLSLLAFFILLDRFAEGIRCYECSSAWNDDCNMSPPPSRYLKLCSVPLCSKFYSEDNGIVRVERYCGGSDFSNGCRDATFPQGPPGLRSRAISCRCNDQDGCNSQEGLKSGIVSIFSGIIFLIFLRERIFM